MSRLQHQVAQFHQEFGHPIGDTPHVPPEERVRFRMRLIAEEFFEVLEAVFGDRFDEAARSDGYSGCYGGPLEVRAGIDEAPIQVDLTALVDALGDLDYVVEGCRLEFGIDGDPVAAEIHRSNMAKRGAGKREDSKQLKPEGWKPPDIAGVLAQQGSLRAKLLGPG